MFDWYSAPVASHHTYREVYRWFGEEGLQVEADNNSHCWGLRDYVYFPWSVTVKGRKPRLASGSALSQCAA
jgi:hypothetical protein